LCLTLRNRLIPTLILIPLSECRVVMASFTTSGAFRSKTAWATTSKAPLRAAVAVLNAPSISQRSWIPSGCSFHPHARAAESVSRWFDAESKLHVVGPAASRADPVRARGTSQAQGIIVNSSPTAMVDGPPLSRMPDGMILSVDISLAGDGSDACHERLRLAQNTRD